MNDELPEPDILLNIKNQSHTTVSMLAGMELDIFTLECKSR